MANQINKKTLKTALIIAALTTVAAFFGALNLLQVAYKENPEYTKWQTQTDEKKNLKKEDGQAAHPMPSKELPLTENEINIVASAMASFAFLPSLVICFWVMRRKE